MYSTHGKQQVDENNRKENRTNIWEVKYDREIKRKIEIIRRLGKMRNAYHKTLRSKEKSVSND